MKGDFTSLILMMCVVVYEYRNFTYFGFAY